MNNLLPYSKTENAEWSGYTLDQIRMRRALVGARMEIQKFKLTSQLTALKEKTPVFGNSSSLFSRITGALSFAEYAVIAIRVFKFTKGLFRKKR